MMKRFFLGKFVHPQTPDAARAKAVAFVSACMRGTKASKAVYNETVGHGPRGDGFGFDFSVEVWLDEPPCDLDIPVAVKAAEASGIDPNLTRTVIAKEHIIKTGNAAVKGTFLSKRRPDSTVPEYLRYWRNEHATIIQAQKDFFAFVRRYVQNHFVHGSYWSIAGASIDQEDAFDGAPQMWFDSADDIYAAFQTEGYLRQIKADEKILVKVGYSQSYISREWPISLPDWTA